LGLALGGGNWYAWGRVRNGVRVWFTVTATVKVRKTDKVRFGDRAGTENSVISTLTIPYMLTLSLNAVCLKDDGTTGQATGHYIIYGKNDCLQSTT